MKAVLRRLQRGAYLCGVVRVVVDQGDTAHLAADLEAPADALELSNRIYRDRNRHTDTDHGGERRQRVRRVVLSWQPGGDDGQDFSLVPRGEAHPVPVDLDVASLPVGATAKTIGFDVGARPAEQTADSRIVGVGDQAVLCSEVFEQLSKDRLVGRRIRKDVGVVPIDVGEHRQLRGEVQELGARIEDRRGVLVALEDELSPTAPGGRGAEVLGGHAEAEAGVASGCAKDPGDQAGCRGLPRRAGHHDAKAVSGQLAPVLGLADEPNVVLPSSVGFRIAIAHLVALDDEVGLSPARDVGGRVAVDPLDPGPRQEVRRRWIGVLVRAGDLVAADADEMDAHQCGRATCSMSLTTSSAAYGRPNPRMASTILRYRASSSMTEVTMPRRRRSASSSATTMAAPADSYGLTFIRWWPPA